MKKYQRYIRKELNLLKAKLKKDYIEFKDDIRELKNSRKMKRRLKKTRVKIWKNKKLLITWSIILILGFVGYKVVTKEERIYNVLDFIPKEKRKMELVNKKTSEHTWIEVTPLNKGSYKTEKRLPSGKSVITKYRYIKDRIIVDHGRKEEEIYLKEPLIQGISWSNKGDTIYKILKMEKRKNLVGKKRMVIEVEVQSFSTGEKKIFTLGEDLGLIGYKDKSGEFYILKVF